MRYSWIFLIPLLVLACGDDAEQDAVTGTDSEHTVDSTTGDSNSYTGIADSDDSDEVDTDTGGDTETTTVTGPTGEVHYFGRFDTREPGTPGCAWSNCGVGVRFKGDALDVQLSGAGNISFQVVLDGGLHTTISTSGSTWNSSSTVNAYRIVEGAGPGMHDVQIYRNPEASFGVVKFHGFEVTNGALVESPFPFSRKIEIVGDSISAGYGNAGCPWAPENEIGSAAYGPLAARELGAIAHVVAVSGNGMVTAYGGETDGQMPELYGYALPGDTQTSWDYTSYVPDVVVINLGTNDFSSNHGGMDRDVFIDTYETFITRLRGYYPNAYILCAINGARSTFSDEIDEVIANLGDSNVEKINLDAPNWNGCHGHPDLEAHQVMANSLVARLQAELGWSHRN